MRRFLLITAAVFGLCSGAHAADVGSAPLVTKSGVLGFPGYPYNGGSGFYAGVNAMGGVAQSSASGSGAVFATSLATGNLTAAGGGVGGTVGYTTGGSNFWWALEASGDWMNVSASSSGASVDSRWSSEQVFKIGGNLAFNFLNSISAIGVNFPTFSLPLTPNGISVAAAPHPYIYGGVKEFGINGTVGQAGGTTVGVAPLVGAGTISSILNGQGAPTGLALDLFAEVVFASKGLSLSNVLGTGGAPVNANIAMANQYWAGAKVLF